MAAMAIIITRSGGETQTRPLIMPAVFSFPNYFVDSGVGSAILVVARLDQ
jgi:hypothetical protein